MKYTKPNSHLMSISLFLRLLAAAVVVLALQFPAAAQPVCDPDITPPLAVCDGYVTVDVSSGPATVAAFQVDEGSFDNCTPIDSLDLRLEAAPPSATPPVAPAPVTTTTPARPASCATPPPIRTSAWRPDFPTPATGAEWPR